MIENEELINLIEEYVKNTVIKLELNLLNSNLFKLDIFNKIKNKTNDLSSLKLNEISNQFIPSLKKNLCLGFFEDIYKQIVLNNVELDNLKEVDLKEIYHPIKYLKNNTEYNYICLLLSIYEITIEFINYLDINQPSFKSQENLKNYIKNYSYDFFLSKRDFILKTIFSNHDKYSHNFVLPNSLSQIIKNNSI